MVNNSDQFWKGSPEEIKRGYVEEEDYYLCLLCGRKIDKGIVYPEEGLLYEAERYMRAHIDKAHQSVFEHLIQLDKRITGLTEHQKSLLQLFYQGKSDGEVQQEMGIGSASTIRNHRFVLKEKERQAKVFLVLMDLLKDKNKRSPGYLPPHNTATMIDDRYNLTQEENEKIIAKYFPEGRGGPLKTLAMKEKNRLAVLRVIAGRFEAQKLYSEKEVNAVLKKAYADFATLRRYLIEYGFMDRRPDGSQYWLKEAANDTEGEAMDRKKELKQLYKEMKTEGGIYQIRNTKNNKVFVTYTPNFKTINGRRGMLAGGVHKNRQLQEEWNQYGSEAFVFEVLEVLKEKEEGFFDRADELKKLEKKWLEKLQPYDDRGYNKPPREKEAGTKKN